MRFGLQARRLDAFRERATASRRRRRAFTIAMSVGARYSSVRSVIGPMPSWIEASCMEMPFTPL